MNTELIRRLPLFATLSDEEFRNLERVFQVKNYRKSQVISWEEETGDYMYVVLAGKVKVVKSAPSGRETIVAIHQAGDFFGEMALLDGKSSPATVAAMEDCRIATIYRAYFHSLMLTNEKILRQIIEVLCGRLRQLMTQVQDLSSCRADDRIRNGLMELSHRHGVRDARGIVIDLKITHLELARLVGTSRETVTRTLTSLQKKGVLKLDHRRIVLLKPGKPGKPEGLSPVSLTGGGEQSLCSTQGDSGDSPSLPISARHLQINYGSRSATAISASGAASGAMQSPGRKRRTER